MLQQSTPPPHVAACRISDMKPRCSVSTNDGYEILCNFDFFDVVKNKDAVAHDPDPNPPRPDYLENHHQHNNYRFTAVFKAIKAANPDFRFDTIDVIISSSALAGLLLNWAVPTLGHLTLDLFGNTLVISGMEAYTHHKFWSQSSDIHALHYLATTQPSKNPHRAVKYNLGGLSIIVVSEPNLTYTDTGTGTGRSKKHRKGKTAPVTDCAAMFALQLGPDSCCDNNLHNSIVSWLSRAEYIAKMKVEQREGVQNALNRVAGVLHWLREAVIAKSESSTKFKVGGWSDVEGGAVSTLALYDTEQDSRVLHRMYGEFWDNPTTGYDAAEQDTGDEDIAECLTKKHLQALAEVNGLQRFLKER
ncbi:hypothetical protein FPSE_08315 [Fusarium pseudograminearum CS3096]|uniref:Uncharacterized protein n=1 Tax=Fusarium pseudograminearum (strain CS3096) TaxID=1028729 RepID=K3VC86_FUSPC|nr:hypothetical protein FPSE_08315 [Fusarium pseudograminearum CS3096]EKJ71502.1 hypothetical protein FPSE_08315 [Fusarium pseudograminearum CS3096]